MINLSHFLLVFLLLTFRPVLSQPSDPTAREKDSTPVIPSLKIGALFQTMGEWSSQSGTTSNGLYVSNMRLKLTGEPIGGVGYFLLTNFVKSYSLLDAYVWYQSPAGFRVDAGQFRAPYSAEYTIIAGEIEFTERSFVSDRLSPGRQTGLMFTWRTAGREARVRGGVFNGNGIGSGLKNDNRDFLYVARLEWYPVPRQAGWSLTEPITEFGLNAARSSDQSVRLAGAPDQQELAAFSGIRTLLGGDFRHQKGDWLLSGEYTRLIADRRELSTIRVDGFHLTGGYLLHPDLQFLLRVQSISHDGYGNRLSEWVTGLNWFPSPITKCQLNVAWREEETGAAARVTAKWQVMF
ncbi:MAG: hypothetical protein HUU10_07345 [Bacteroidetes bacterium]|nr:hypothetical protein [Bacteroidota bacterium]